MSVIIKRLDPRGVPPVKSVRLECDTSGEKERKDYTEVYSDDGDICFFTREFTRNAITTIIAKPADAIEFCEAVIELAVYEQEIGRIRGN